MREALVAAARGAAAGGDRAAFERIRAEYVVALSPEREAQWGEALAQATDATIVSVLDALVSGADAAACLRALASVLPGTQSASAELVEASLLLAPERRMTHLTRALLRFQRGDRAGALADADVVAGESTDAAESLRSYAEIVFRRFDDWPGRETFAPDPELDGVPIEPAHELDDIRHVIGVYATRLDRARDAIRALRADALQADADTSAWLPPDLSPALPGGPVPLRHETVECEPEEEGEGEGEAEGQAAAPVATARRVPASPRPSRSTSGCRPTGRGCRCCWRPRTPTGPRSAGCAGRSGWTVSPCRPPSRAAPRWRSP